MSDARFVELDRVCVTFGEGPEQTEALQPTDLTVAKGDFLALVGPFWLRKVHDLEIGQ